MQNNLQETQKLNEKFEIEQTRFALQSELNMNKKFVNNVRPALVTPLNIDREMTQAVGSANLRKMFQ